MNIKKLIFLLLLIFPTISFSQNLIYNKTLLISTTDTVPQGKTWKVVSVLPSDNLLSTSSSGNWSSKTLEITVNNSAVHIAGSTNQAGYRIGYSSSYNPLPIWLPSGTTVSPSNNCHSISVIEFNE